MQLPISLGNQGFASLRENHCFYIDKTDFIREWWEEQDVVTLITRPRRFGKTLNLNMMECFFSTQYKDRSVSSFLVILLSVVVSFLVRVIFSTFGVFLVD